jgi:GT2 family glycosyltransferase
MKESKFDISIVIVSFNVKNLLRNCLRSVGKARYELAIEIFVIDSGSDESYKMVQEEFPEIHTIKRPQNDGFARANNLAIKNARGKYVLILNPDTEILPATLKRCFEYMEKHQKIGVLGCRVELPDGSLDIACRRSFPTPSVALSRMLFLSRLFPKSPKLARYNLTFLPEDQIYQVDCVVGAYMMVRNLAIHDVGLMDEDYWMYGEDIDFCYRVKKAGWEVIYYPKARIIHYKGASSGLTKSSSRVTSATFATKLKTIKAFHEAMHIFYAKHYRVIYPKWLNKIVMLAIQARLYLAIATLYLKYRNVFIGG